MDSEANLSQGTHRSAIEAGRRFRFANYLTSGPVLGMIGVALAIGWCAGFVVHHVSARGLVDQNNIVLGRDFMAFYVGGSIVVQGDGSRLYEPELQQATQNTVVAPEKLEGLSYFINPASVAVAYSLLARLPYLSAFYLHTALMMACFFAGMHLLRPHLATGSLHWLTIALVAACWMPMMHTITGGQNAALSFLLLAAAYVATVDQKQWLAGLSLGLLLFKPHYAVPVLGLLLLRGQWRTLCIAGVVGVGHYIVGALFCGWDWPVLMADQLGSYYRQAEDATNSATHMSLLEVLDYSVIQPLGGGESVAGLIHLCGYAVLGLVVVYLIWVWRHADPGRPDFGLYWALVTAATLVLSPHAQYYDGALLILPVVLILSHICRANLAVSANARLTLVVLYVAYFPLVYLPVWFEWFRFQPVFLVPIGVCAWSVALIKRSRRSAA